MCYAWLHTYTHYGFLVGFSERILPRLYLPSRPAPRGYAQEEDKKECNDNDDSEGRDPHYLGGGAFLLGSLCIFDTVQMCPCATHGCTQE